MHPEVYEGVSRIKGDSFNHGQQCILLIKETLIIVAWKWEKSAKNSFAERRLTAHRKSLQGKLAHDIVALGNTITIEKTSFKAWQKQYGRSIGLRAPGMLCTSRSPGVNYRYIYRYCNILQICTKLV